MSPDSVFARTRAPRFDGADVQPHAGSVFADTLDVVGQAAVDVAAEGLDFRGQAAGRRQAQDDVAAHAFDVDAPVARELAAHFEIARGGAAAHLAGVAHAARAHRR